MTMTPNELAPHHLPWFIAEPGQTDGLLVATGIFLVVVLLAVGNLYFQLHALPERWAHKRSPVQVQIVAILALLALFTHNNIFWIAALLLALVQLPDFATPIYSIADSLKGLAGRSRGARQDGAGPVAMSPGAESAINEGRLAQEIDVVEVIVAETEVIVDEAATKGGANA